MKSLIFAILSITQALLINALNTDLQFKCKYHNINLQ